MDRRRESKKVSNEDWESKSDPQARITKMKNGTTHLAYKAEHVIDLESEVILAATIHAGTRSNGETFFESVSRAHEMMVRAGIVPETKEVVADKGYSKAEALAEWALRTWVPERKERQKRRWVRKPAGWKRRVTRTAGVSVGTKGRRLHRLRSERNERSFAHVCGTGRQRRTDLRGRENVFVSGDYQLSITPETMPSSTGC